MGAVVQASVERAGGRTLMRFTRAFDDTFTSDGGGEPYGVLAAHHPTEATLGAPHIGRTPFSFDLSGGSAAAGEDPLNRWRRNHAALMITGWGVLLPLGVASANTLRTHGPIWCAGCSLWDAFCLGCLSRLPFTHACYPFSHTSCSTARGAIEMEC